MLMNWDMVNQEESHLWKIVPIRVNFFPDGYKGSLFILHCEVLTAYININSTWNIVFIDTDLGNESLRIALPSSVLSPSASTTAVAIDPCMLCNPLQLLYIKLDW